MDKATKVITFCIICASQLAAASQAQDISISSRADAGRWVEDFETTNGGLVPDPATEAWEWGTIMSGPGTAHSGTKVWATILADNYTHRADWKITSQVYVATEDNPSIFFYHWYMFENLWDGGNVKFSTDNGASWPLLHPVGGYDGVVSDENVGIPAESCFTGFNTTWGEEEFVIPVAAGQTLQFRLHFGSDPVVQYPGWYVDDLSGIGLDLVGIEEGVTGMGAGTYALFGAAPNPMNQATHIAFNLPRPDRVTLRLYDIHGRRAATILEDAALPAGLHDVAWPGVDGETRILPAGVYFYELVTPAFRATEKLIISR